MIKKIATLACIAAISGNVAAQDYSWLNDLLCGSTCGTNTTIATSTTTQEQLPSYSSSTSILKIPALTVDGVKYRNIEVRLREFDVLRADQDTNSTKLETWYGDWQAQFTGSDSGTCNFTVRESTTTSARISGVCNSNGFGTSFAVAGYVQESGSFTAGSTTNGASFVGTFSATTAEGTWSVFGGGGEFAASKR